MGFNIKKSFKNMLVFIFSLISVLALISISQSGNFSDAGTQIKKYLIMLLSGNLGQSLQGKDVAEQVLICLPRTLTVSVLSFVIASITGILIGMLLSYRGGRGKKTFQVIATTIPISIPDVFIILLLQLFMITLHKNGIPNLPVSGYENIANYVLPVVSLSIIPAFYAARITFAMAVEAHNEKFVLTSRAKGCTETRVHTVHVWRKIGCRVIDSLPTLIPIIISNLLIVEKMYIFHGLAYNFVFYFYKGDMNFTMGMALGLAAVYALTMLSLYIVKAINSVFNRSISRI